MASIAGLILIILGVILLAYYADPIRLMLREYIPHKTNLIPPVLGAVALVIGIALMSAAQLRN